MNNELMFSSANDAWATPQEYFDKINERFNFNLDVACDNFNCKTEIGFCYDDGEDGLKERWTILENNIHDQAFDYTEYRESQKSRVYCNPPYSDLKNWIKKASEEIKKDYCEEIVMLIPSRTDTIAFHEYIYNKPGVEIEFIKGRLTFGTDAYWEWLWEQEFTYDSKGKEKKNSLYKKYGKKNPAPFPSMLVIFKSL